MASKRSPVTLLRNRGAAAIRQLPVDVGRGMTASEIDWDKWSRHIESRRRRMIKIHASESIFGTRTYLAEATYVSFKLESLDVSEIAVTTALATGLTRRLFRSRQAQRVRNHVASLRAIDSLIDASAPLTPAIFMRWYTSISCGLCPADLAEAAYARLSENIHRVNFPELRLAGAVQEIARLHRGLLMDPIVPSFNGILSRLILRYHLGRCGLPPIFFHPDTPVTALTSERMLLPLIMELIDNSYEVMLTYAVA
jgi:hypothetical protein